MEETEGSYYQQITYEEYVALVEDLIRKSRKETIYYLSRLTKCNSLIKVSDKGLKDFINQKVCEYYSKKFSLSLENLLELIDYLNLISRIGKDNFVYFMDQNGLPQAVYIPEPLRKKMRTLSNNNNYVY